MPSRYGCLIFLGLLISGCASSLNQWKTAELVPYLSKELSQHPQFKEQPLALVDMTGIDIDPNIDRLTKQLQDSVFQALLQSPGANLVWQTTGSSHAQHHTHLYDVQCQPRQQPRFFIGFDLKPQDNHYQLSVKALDPQQSMWVSGFGMTWEGELSAHELRQYQAIQTDERLRGLRMLPFSAKDTDLIARYLAKNISCLLKQSPIEPMVLYSDHAAAKDTTTSKIHALVDLYLSQYNEVQLTHHEEQANLILRPELHHIDEHLYQLWLIIKDRQQRSIRGLDTSVYLTLQEAPQPIEWQDTPRPPRQTVPPVVVVPSTEPQDRQPSRPVPQQPLQIIERLQRVQPIGEPFCRTANPWVMGAIELATDERTPYCFGLELQLKQRGYVLLINENDRGQFMKLPSHTDNGVFKLSAGQNLRYPNRDLFDLEPGAQQEWIHVFAVRDQRLTQQLLKQLNDMPECCTDNPTGPVIDWRKRFKTWQTRFADRLEWRTVRVWR